MDRIAVAVRILSILSIPVTFCVVCGEAYAGEVLEAGNVRVEFPAGERRRAEAVPDVVARARGELARALGLSAPEKVTVRLLFDKRAFLGIADGKPVELYAGRAYPESGTIHVNTNSLRREARADAFSRTVRHEFVHLAVGHTLMRAGGGRSLPRWFEEGLACYVGSPLPRPEAEILHRGRAFRLRALSEFPRERRALSLAYAESESVVRFLARTRSTDALRDVLRRVASGDPFEEALAAGTGYDVDSLEAAWRRSLGPAWGWWLARFVLSPGGIFLWLALFVVAGYFVVRRRRRRQAETLDAYP